MPTKTRALAKGVPPRLRSPAKSKKQLRKSNKKRKKNPTGSSDESESSESDDARPKAKVKKHAKRHRTYYYKFIQHYDSTFEYSVLLLI
jgi:hypothetical protein